MGCGASKAEAGAAAPGAAPKPVNRNDPNYPPMGLAPTVQGLPEWIKLGCGDSMYICEEKGATFPADKCPEQLPDLSKHGNLCAMALRDHPEIYEKYTLLDFEKDCYGLCRGRPLLLINNPPSP